MNFSPESTFVKNISTFANEIFSTVSAKVNNDEKVSQNHGSLIKSSDNFSDMLRSSIEERKNFDEKFLKISAEKKEETKEVKNEQKESAEEYSEKKIVREKSEYRENPEKIQKSAVVEKEIPVKQNNSENNNQVDNKKNEAKKKGDTNEAEMTQQEMKISKNKVEQKKEIQNQDNEIIESDEDFKKIDEEDEEIQEYTEIIKNIITIEKSNKNNKDTKDKVEIAAAELDNLINDLSKIILKTEKSETLQSRNEKEGNQPELKSAMKYLQNLKTKMDKNEKIEITDEKSVNDFNSIMKVIKKYITIKELNDNQNDAKQTKAKFENILNEGIVSSTNFDAKKNETTVKFSFNETFEKNSTNLKDYANQKSTDSGNNAKAVIFKNDLNDIINSAKLVVRDNNNSSLNFKLNPETLGNVNVKLGIEDGILKAQFLVESNEAKNSLIQNIEDLKTRLMEQGLEVGEFNVTVKDHEQRNFRQFEKPEILSFNRKKNKESEASMVYEQSSVLQTGRIDMVG